MQSLWSRAARLPSSSCRCNVCLRTYANGVASRPATASTAGRRGLRVGNAVTALYSSIFAGAAIADARAKSKRRQEWDDKIAAVKEEVNELVDEERRLLEALSLRQNNHPPTTQTRSYSTSSRIGPLETRSLRGSHSLASRVSIGDGRSMTGSKSITDDATINSHTTTAPAEEIQVESSSTKEAEVEAEVEKSAQEDIEDEEIDNMEYESLDDLAKTNNSIPRPEPDFIWERSSIVRIKAIQKLAVQQLIYRLLVRPSIVHDYSGLPVEYQLEDSPARPPSVLLRRLRAVRRRLYSLKYIRNSPYDDLMQNVGIEELDSMRRSVRERYDAFLKQDIQQYLKGKLTLQKLLMQVADNLLSCEEPDRPFAFALLISAFTKTHQNDLADLVLKCLVPNLFQLSTPLIIDIISHYRKTKNLKDFDLFLKMLRGEGGYPVNLRTTWQKKTVNGVTITVPPMSSFNPIILTSVITATLRFDQPERAEAYMHIARASGFVDNFATLSAFLRFYALRKDYKSGLATLSSALNFIVSSSDLKEERIARLILYMADFCACCDRKDLFYMIIHAAVKSGLDCTTAHKLGDTSSYLNTSYRKWRQKQEKSKKEISAEQPLSERCAIFNTMATGHLVGELRRVNGTAPRTAPNLHMKSRHATLQPPTTTTTTHTSSGPTPDSSNELKSLRSQLEVLYLRIEQLSSSGGGSVFAEQDGTSSS